MKKNMCARVGNVKLGNGSALDPRNTFPSKFLKKDSKTVRPSSGFNTSLGFTRLRNQENRKSGGFEEITTSHTNIQ